MNMRIKITTNLIISLKSSIWSPANSWIRFTCSLVCPWMSFIEWSWSITLELKHNLSSQQTIFLIWIGLIRTVGSIPLTRLWTLEVEFLKKQERRTELSVKSDASIESQVEILHFKLPLLQFWDLNSMEVFSPEWSRWPSVRSNIWKWGGWTTWNFDNSFPTQSSPPPVTHCLPQSSMLQQLLSIFTNACIISIDLKQISSCPAFTCFIRAQLQSKAGKVWSQTLLPPKCYQSVRSRQCPPWFVTCLPDTAWPRFSL